MRLRRSSALMSRDPYTLVVALSAEQSAEGTLYLDDGAWLSSYSASTVLQVSLEGACSNH